ncbi:MAG: hypothetical protein WCB04_14635 [Mycobacteriales bacterium]
MSRRGVSLLRRLDDRAVPALAGLINAVVRRRARIGWTGAAIAVLAVVAVVLANTGLHGGGPAPQARSVTRVGALEGTGIPSYVSASRRELAGLTSAGTTPAYALVSLAGYGTPAQAAAVAAGYSVSKAFFRVPLLGVQTEIRAVDVTDLSRDLEARMRSAAAQVERDAKDSDDQVKKLTGSSAQERQLRAFYVQSARLLRVQAARFRALCACVYAFVVRAVPEALTKLASRSGVRVVDPAPEITALDRAVFLPLLPEQRVTVEPPADAGLPPVATPSSQPSPARS